MMQLLDLILANASVQAIVVMALVYLVVQAVKALGKMPANEGAFAKRLTAIVTAVLLCALTELARSMSTGNPYDVWAVVTQIIAVIAGSTGIHTLGKAMRTGTT